MIGLPLPAGETVRFAHMRQLEFAENLDSLLRHAVGDAPLRRLPGLAVEGGPCALLPSAARPARPARIPLACHGPRCSADLASRRDGEKALRDWS